MHTPLEVGFWNSRQVSECCKLTRTQRGGEFIARLRELVMVQGDAKGRLPQRYTAADVEFEVGWEGKPGFLVRALQAIKALGRAGRRFFYVDWSRSQAGNYTERREEDRLRKKRERKAQAAARLAQIAKGGDSDVPRPSAGHPSDGGRNIHSKGAAGAAPPGPPKGGRGAQARYSWFLENFPKTSDPEATKALLADLTAEEWELCQFAVPKLVLRYKWSHTHRKAPNSVLFLSRRQFVECTKEFAGQKRKAAEKKNGAHKAPPIDATAEKIAQRKRFLTAELTDRETTEARRETLTREWQANYPDEPVPEQQAGAN